MQFTSQSLELQEMDISVLHKVQKKQHKIDFFQTNGTEGLKWVTAPFKGK